MWEAEKTEMDAMVLGGTYGTFHRARAMVVGRDVLKGGGMRQSGRKRKGQTKSRCREEGGFEGERESERRRQQT
jgi:hypothetical protein